MVLVAGAVSILETDFDNDSVTGAPCPMMTDPDVKCTAEIVNPGNSNRRLITTTTTYPNNGIIPCWYQVEIRVVQQKLYKQTQMILSKY